MIRLFTFLFLLILTACARPSKPIWTELPSSEALLQQLVSTTGQVDSLDGSATVNLTVKGKFLSSQQFLLLEKPDRLRADVMTLFGQLVLQLTSDGEELAVFMNTTVPGRFFRGPATAENMARFTRIPLASNDIVRLLLYDPPLIAYQQSEVLVDKDELVLRLTDPEMQQELFFNEKLQLVGCRYISEDKVLFEVLYQKLTAETFFPQTIRLKMAAEETKAAIKFSELQMNIEIPADRFRLKKPDNISVEALP